MDLRIHDVGCHDLLGQLCLTPLLCLSKNHTKTWQMEPEHASLEDPVWYKWFCSFVARFLPGHIITLWAELVLGRMSSSMNRYSPAVQYFLSTSYYSPAVQYSLHELLLSGNTILVLRVTCSASYYYLLSWAFVRKPVKLYEAFCSCACIVLLLKQILQGILLDSHEFLMTCAMWNGK